MKTSSTPDIFSHLQQVTTAFQVVPTSQKWSCSHLMDVSADSDCIHQLTP